MPDGMARTLENQQTFRMFERAPHFVGQVARATQTGGEAVGTARPSASDASTGLKTRG